MTEKQYCLFFFLFFFLKNNVINPRKQLSHSAVFLSGFFYIVMNFRKQTSHSSLFQCAINPIKQITAVGCFFFLDLRLNRNIYIYIYETRSYEGLSLFPVFIFLIPPLLQSSAVQLSNQEKLHRLELLHLCPSFQTGGAPRC